MQRHFETNCHQKSDLKPNYLPLCFHALLPSYDGVDICELCYSLRKIPKFFLISWCGNFVETHSFYRVSGALRKLCVSTEVPH